MTIQYDDPQLQAWVDAVRNSGVKNSMNKFTGDGATIVYDINFAGGYLYKADIRAYKVSPTSAKADVEIVAVDDNRVTLAAPVEAGWTLVIYRDTPKNAPLVDFSDNSIVNERNLDTNFQQAVFAVAEMLDRFDDTVTFTLDAYAAAERAEASEAAALASEQAAAASASVASSASATATTASSQASASATSAATAAGQATSSAANAAASANTAGQASEVAVDAAAAASVSAAIATSAASAADSAALIVQNVGGVSWLPAGLAAPVVFASGLAVTAATTVIRAGALYSANPAAVPFTTTATFDPGQWVRLYGVSRSELAGAGGAALVGAAQNYTVADQLAQTVEYARYLAAPSASPTSAFNAAVSALMGGGGGRLKIKAGSYSLALDQITANVPNLVIEGDGMYNTHLVFPKAAGTAMKFDGGNRVFFKDIHVSGYDGTGNYFASGSIGIDTAANIIGENAWFDGFANLFSWRGGFYHRFYGCRFNKAQCCFNGFNANNFQLHVPQIAEVDSVGDFNAGSGPIVVVGGAIEKWTSNAFGTSGGARPHIMIVGTYIENYPRAAAGNGLAKANYQGAFLTSGFGSVTLQGNMGSLNGIRRLVANGGIDTRSIVSTGNEWQYQKGAGSDTDFFFVYQNLENGLFHDSLRNNITGQTGGYTPAYRAGSVLKPLAVTGYDPVADVTIYGEPPWLAATLVNGWANADATNYQSAGYKRIGNRVHLRGYVSGSGATSQSIMVLPSGYYDDKYVVLTTSSLGGTPVAITLRVLNNGTVRIENTNYTTTGPFPLDGLSFAVD